MAEQRPLKLIEDPLKPGSYKLAEFESGDSLPVDLVPGSAPLQRRIIKLADRLYLIGEAAPGSAEDAAVWRIFQRDLRLIGLPPKIHADNDGDFVHKWTEAADKTYA